MPKRKSEESCDKLFKKLKKLEKKLRQRCRSRSSSSSRSGIQEEHVAYSEDCENNIVELLDGSNLSNVEAISGGDADPLPECTASQAAEPVVAAGTSATPTDNVANALSCAESADAIPESVILDILGEDPTISNTYGPEVQKDLAVRLEHIATHGLTKELRKDLQDKYLLPNNCRLINAPGLNAEIKAAVSDVNIKRDRNIEFRQKQTATAIACLSQAINKLISKNNADPELTKMLMDSERILCDLQYNDSVIRRNFILSSLNKDMKDQLLNTKPDNLLFGQNLSETIKTAKAITRSGADLKTPVQKPQASNKKPPASTSTPRNLNWKGPFPPRKQPNQPKAKGPPPSSRPSSSSRHSQQPPKRSRR
ncbi:uncharacterized protein LOC124641341 [Helicoverpa zea]|uniref:uncharacterized protein LOC124641341 n=1 Tax=Helicoverpa zea TaxID=7113 RepID=UPI001F575215|nr:uncharacterized protein LOC124641341 [Helicoverpa zea]